MTAMAQSQGPLIRYRGDDWNHIRPWGGKYKAGKYGLLYSLNMQVDGIARPLVSGAAMDALATPIGTGNSGLKITARRKGVKFAIIDPGGNSKERHIRITTSGAFTVVSLYAATGSGGAITTTSQETQDAIRANAEADALLRVKLAGDGTGAVVAAAAADVVAIERAGFLADREIDGGAEDLVLPPDLTFVVNEPGDGVGLLLTGTAPVEGGKTYLIDDQTCSATPASALDLEAVCVGVRPDLGLYFIDVAGAR